MKTVKTVAFAFLFGLSSQLLMAQNRIPVNEPNYNKPTLFKELPHKMVLTISDLEPLFDISNGTAVIAKLTKDFQFKGTIVSKSGDAKSAVRSVIISSATHRSAVLNFTKITNQDGSFVYQGRILSMESIDAYEILKEDNQYVLVKKNYYEMVRE
jgi:hypothetical protein